MGFHGTWKAAKLFAVVSGQLELCILSGVEIRGVKFMAYFLVQGVSLIGIVVWFAGLFYLVRLLSITLRRMNSQNQPARFSRISIRLWKSGLSLPGMVVTAVAIGLLLNKCLRTVGYTSSFFVAILIAYHFLRSSLKQLAAEQCA